MWACVVVRAVAVAIVAECQHVLDVYEAGVVSNAGDEAVLVDADIEDRQGAGGPRSDTICVRVVLPGIVQAVPLGMRGCLVPLPQRFL